MKKIKEGFKYLDKQFLQLTDKQKKYIILFFSTGLFLLMFQLNRITPLNSDDYQYSLALDGRKLSSMRDIIDYQWHHYFNWGGRSVAHIIAQYLLFLPSICADALNALIYICFILVVYLHCKGSAKRQSPTLFLFIFFIMWFCQPAFADVALWITGSANYLWTMTLVLAFLLRYRLYHGEDNQSKLKIILTSIFYFIFGIIAGWTNENISITLILFICIFILYWKRNMYKIPIWSMIGLMGVIIGSIILLLAPGNFVRLDTITPHTNVWFMYFYKFNVFTNNFFLHLGYINILLIIFIILISKFDIRSIKEIIPIIFFYLFATFFSLYIMLFSPTFPARAWFGIIGFNIIAFGIVYINLALYVDFFRYIRYSIFSLTCLAFIFNFYYSYKQINTANLEWLERDAKIKKALSERKDTVIVPLISSHNSRFVLMDVPWIDQTMSKYYNIQIQFSSQP